MSVKGKEMNSAESFELRKFVAPEFVYGTDARFLVGRYSRNFGARKVLVVTDPGIIEAGWTSQIVASLEKEGIPSIVFSSVTTNPRSDDIMAGAQVYRSEGCNLIVAVGGGSPMDCAKGIGIVHTNNIPILEFAGVDQVPVPGPPLICIPTTAGSSADVSQFAIITDLVKKVKIAIVSKTVVPDVALIDPVTTTTMDVDLTAHTGMDALTHGIEAFVSNASSPITDLHALEAIRLVSANLLKTLFHIDDLSLRSILMLGSLHAGLAFSNASLGILHAMAHSLGGYLDLAHGHCNAILLPYIINYNFDAVPERYCRIGEAMGIPLQGMSLMQKKKAIMGEVERIQQAAGVCQRLGEMGVSRADIPNLAENAMFDACIVTNPRRPSRRDVEELYEKAF